MLPRDTEQVWNLLKDQPVLAGFVLVGGSALTLRIDHRVSEDLDLAWTQARLPRNRLEALRRAAEEALRLASLRYRAGLLPLTDLLATDAEASAARAVAVEASTAVTLAYYRLLHAQGDLR